MSRKMKDKAPKLSSNVLEMKFMKRTKLKLETKEKQKKDQELFSECNPSTSEGVLNNNILDQVEICRDWQQLEGLVFGRQSFKGFNPEVEIPEKEEEKESDDDGPDVLQEL
ncbi:hypothetical protein WR25_07167 [Diploscapter pachys]|uniref:M-phase phosphoprotein 6 n=1 Tax=Diploscapter pachys TaxID=2018661 RepID=A0A2A2KUD4_9BILA|nr:hypothetical protein WR25_07167 [Diploscapter pachys]